MAEILQLLNDNAPAFGVGVTAVIALTGYLTYLATKARLTQATTQGRSGLVADALALQDAAQNAYEKAIEEAILARQEFVQLRTEIQEIRDEMVHWRAVAEAGRDAAIAAGDPIPGWFKIFAIKEA